MVKKEALRKEALQAGFVRVRFLAPFEPVGAAPFEPAGASAHYRQGAPALLVAALPYGNQLPSLPAEGAPPALAGALSIAPFAQRNYYREAVKRLQKLAVRFREQYGRENPSYGLKRNYRIFCNSPVPEKPLGLASGLGVLGRNGLLITPEAGSLVIIAALTLPFPLE
ncbi:MAG: hypothetical protein LBT16_08530, partial [Treponema sp.]|nr:hypothetical protein [Treponema sp.]